MGARLPPGDQARASRCAHAPRDGQAIRAILRAVQFTGPLLDGRWRLGRRMGAGAQAHTYLARDERDKDDRVVVVKQFRLEKNTWKKFDLFEREAQVLGRLRHPGIPRLLASFESEPGVFNLVLERMPGASLRAIATKVRFTDTELRELLVRVLDILDYLHTRNPPVIHRDIKPANLMRDAGGKVALVDFGGVRSALREDGGSTVIGTFGYMAPEQLHGQATPATDIYGLGATIVSLAGGVEPESVPRRGLRMDLRKHLAGRDESLIEVLEAMTEPDPDARPQRAREVVKLLGERMDAPRTPGRTTGRTREQTPGQAQKSSRNLPVPAARAGDLEHPKPFEELGEILTAVPQPIDAVLRVLLLAFAVGGQVAVTVIKAVLLPLVFGLIHMIADKDARPGLATTRNEVRHALDQGREGLRNLQSRCLRSDSEPKKLPRPKSRR
jgi:serine/threonine protein kinase